MKKKRRKNLKFKFSEVQLWDQLGLKLSLPEMVWLIMQFADVWMIDQRLHAAARAWETRGVYNLNGAKNEVDLLICYGEIVKV